MKRRCTTIDGFEKRLIDIIFEEGDMFKDVAAKAGISRSTLCRWRTGEALPALSEMVKFCRTYDISLDYLLGLSDRRERDERI